MPTPPPTPPAASAMPKVAPPLKMPRTLKKKGSAAAPKAKKKFTIQEWTSRGCGEKILLYGPSGIGKTTLASQRENAIFIGIDTGGRKITNPLTGLPIRNIPEIESWFDMRSAFQDFSIWPKEKYTIVIDTLTKAEPWAQDEILETIKVKGATLKTFRGYGWDGDRHLADTFRCLLTDLEAHADRGNDIVLLCQQNQLSVANAEGADYLQDAPYLQHRKDCSVLEEVKQWCDHVARIGYADLRVVAEKSGKGKVTSSDTTHAIYTSGAQHFTAKSRPINGHRLPEAISFEDETDNSFWQYIEGAIAPEEGD